MQQKKSRPVYDMAMMDNAVAGITRSQKKNRSRKYVFVRKHSIDFTAEMWEIIEAHRRQPGTTDNLRETIYRGLQLLKEQENL